MAARRLATHVRGLIPGLVVLLGILAVIAARESTKATAAAFGGPDEVTQAERGGARTPPDRKREHVLEGSKADDVLDGGAGDDWLFGFEGHDVLRGGDGNDTLDGAAGDDMLIGAGGRDVLDGGAGRDSLSGGADNDWLDGGDDEDTIDGGEGNDDMDGGDAADVLNGGAGDDLVAGGDGSDALSGGAGADRVLGRDDDDRLSGGPGDDTIEGGDGRDSISADDGKDSVDGGEGDDIVWGGAGDDTLKGESGNDVLIGEGDNDTLLGSRGDDSLDGGEGHDTLLGDDGADVLNGGPGDDFALGGRGADTIRVGPQDDLIVVRAGDVGAGELELIDGGAGRDSLILIGFNQSDLAESPLGGTALEGHSLTDPLTGGVYRVVGIEQFQHGHLFTHIGSTETLAASFAFVNPSSKTPSSGRVIFFNSEGAPLAQSVSGSAAQPVFPFKVPPLGRLIFDATGASQTARGTALVLADQPLSGVVQTSLSDLGVLRAGQAPLVDSFVVPVFEEKATGADTGVAIFGSTTPSHVKLTLRRPTGDEVFTQSQGAAEIEVPANGHRIVFVRDLFPWVGGDFVGAMTVEGGIDRPQAGGPLAGTGLQREPKTQRISAFPVIPIAPAPLSGPLHFASVPAGGDYRSAITLVNPSSVDRSRGALSFFDQTGKPRMLSIEGLTTTASVSYEIPPMGSVVFATSAAGPVTMGSARVSVKEGAVGAVLRVSSAAGEVINTGPSTDWARFTTHVRRNRGTGVDTRIALSSVASAVALTLVLHDANGAEVAGGRATLQLPPNGSVLETISALFPKANTDDFHGTLVVTTDAGTVAGLILEVSGTPGVVAVMPVAPLRD